MKTWKELGEKINNEPEFEITNDILDEITAADGDMPLDLSKVLWAKQPRLFDKYYVKAWEMLEPANIQFPKGPLEAIEIDYAVNEPVPYIFDVTNAKYMTEHGVQGFICGTAVDVLHYEAIDVAMMGAKKYKYVPMSVTYYSTQDYVCMLNRGMPEDQRESLLKWCHDASGIVYAPWEKYATVVEVIRTEIEVMS